ncbi:MAG: flavin reductase family protein [Deltaproteobacteria bacterium]|nr:flavin reductase family protein [Deltaproteobacteria bacterium]
MKEVDYLALSETVIERIKNGAFLTVKAGDALNTMTIGWATIGFAWGNPTLMVMVRKSRHTFTIMENAADFTVTFPLTNMQKEINLCGTKSGRDLDKFQAANLKIRPARKVISPIIDTPGLHIECTIVYKAAIDPASLVKGHEKLYPRKDYHTLYFGEIQEWYKTN